MRTAITTEEILEAIRQAQVPPDRPPNTFRTAELCDLLGCGAMKAQNVLRLMVKAGQAVPVKAYHEEITGVRRRVTMYQFRVEVDECVSP